jgi:antitoxin component of MazEF toxin-antitoxin module
MDADDTAVDEFIAHDRMPDERTTGTLETPDETLPVEWVPHDAIEPNEWNPNYMGVSKKEELVFSIRDNGWTQPIVVKADTDTIIDGEQRWSAIHEPVMTDDGFYEVAEDEAVTPDGIPAGHVPIFRVSATEEQARVATMQHNVSGEHDIDKLGEIVVGLDDDVAVEMAQHGNIDPVNFERLMDRADVLEDSPPPEEMFDIPWLDDDNPETDSDGNEVSPDVGGGDDISASQVKRLDLLVTEQQYEMVEAVLTEELRTDLFVQMCEYAIDNGFVEEVRVGGPGTAEDLDADEDDAIEEVSAEEVEGAVRTTPHPGPSEGEQTGETNTNRSMPRDTDE